MGMGNVPTAHDNHALWSDFNHNSYDRVNYSGVHGHTWTPPTGNTDFNGDFGKIASPHKAAPKPSGDRIIAHELPARTQSASSLDIPMKKDVLQVDIPNSSTATTTYEYNAATSNGPNL